MEQSYQPPQEPRCAICGETCNRSGQLHYGMTGRKLCYDCETPEQQEDIHW
jgi:hypothetical protein